MHIDATAFRDVEYILRQYEPVSRDDHQVWVQSGQLRDDLVVAQRLRLNYRDTFFLGEEFHRTGRHAFATPGRPIRLRQDGDGYNARLDQRRQRRKRKLRRAGKYHPGIFHDGEVGGGPAVNRLRDHLGRLKAAFFFQFLAYTLAFGFGQVIHKQLAIEMIHFMLDAYRKQTLDIDFLCIPLPIKESYPDMLGTLDFFIETRHRQAPFIGDQNTVLFENLGIYEDVWF